MTGWRQRNGSTRAWRKLRAAVLLRDDYLCQARGPKCTGRATTVGHVIPLALGGTLLPGMAELRAECGPCNYGDGAAMSSTSGKLGRLSARFR